MIEKLSLATRVAGPTVDLHHSSLTQMSKPNLAAAKAAQQLLPAGRVEEPSASQPSLIVTDATGQSVVAARSTQAQVAGQDLEQMKALTDAYREIAAQREVINALRFSRPEVKIIPTRN